jgi:hypothetical protein
MQSEGETDRAVFVRKIITGELAGDRNGDPEEYLRDVAITCVRSPEIQERFRYTIAEILLSDQNRREK